MPTILRFIPIVVLILVISGADVVQAVAVCSDTPGSNDRIECTKDSASTNDIEIDAVNVDIDTSVDGEPGVRATHAGTGDIDVEFRPGTTSTIDTAGLRSYGIQAEHTGTGNIIIDVQNTNVTTNGNETPGFHSKHTGVGDIDIDLDDVEIEIGDTTQSNSQYGIYTEHRSNGDVEIQVKDTTSHGGFATRHFGVGTSTMRLEKTTIDTTFNTLVGIRNSSVSQSGDPIKNGPTHSRTYVTDSEITVSGTRGAGIVAVLHDTSIEGELLIEVDNSIIRTTGERSIGIDAKNLAAVGDVRVTVRGDSEVHSTSHGIHAHRRGIETGTGRGAVRVDIRNTKISTMENGKFGVYVRNESADAMAEDVQRTFVKDSTITTSGYVGYGIYSNRTGDGDNVIETQNVDIVTKATKLNSSGVTFSHGIYAQHSALGNIDINVQGGSLTTEGMTSYGLYGRHQGMGDIDIDMRGGTSVTTKGGSSHAVFGLHEVTTQQDNIDINVQDGFLTTEGSKANGLYGFHQGMGDINITAGGVSITTKGTETCGICSLSDGIGDINLDVRNSSITTESTASINVYGDTLADGVNGYHRGSGDIDIDTERVVIETKGVFSRGVLAYHTGGGNIDLDIRGGSVKTAGEFAYGIYGLLEKTDHGGTISIRTGNGNDITTTGDNGHGIVAYNYGTLNTSSISINVGGNITTTGADAQGVRVGTLSSGAPARVAAIDSDGYYRQQTVTVNGRVTGNAAGVYLAGGGRVEIGPKGSVGAESGIAILATGVVPEDATAPNNVIPAIQPKLRVDLNLGGRRVEQALGNNWIINDGGETTIAVNNIVLHEGATGVTGRTAANGAWNVRMREHGVTIDDRADPDPANWVFTESTDSAPIIADRDFSTQDFTETRRPRPPPPVPPVPVLQVYIVEEPIIGGADDVAGIHVKGDGIVHIGPMGSIRAESGIAILATQDTSGPLSNSSPEGLLFGDVIGGGVDLRSTGAVSEIATLTTGDGPRLTVDMDLDGRRVQDVIGDDWIINDQGETTIIVNGVTLHEGATGIVTDAVAPNGPFNVAMTGEGVMVTDRTDPANWIISDPTLGVIADRDFSAEDFIYLSTPGAPMFMEEYAPRAALYEVLPDFMLRMQKWEPTRQRLSLPESPVYIRLLGSTGSQEFKRSTVNANYDADRSAVEAGVNIPLFENLDIWA